MNDNDDIDVCTLCGTHYILSTRMIKKWIDAETNEKVMPQHCSRCLTSQLRREARR